MTEPKEPRPFDPERDAKSWGALDLEAAVVKKNKRKGLEAKKVVVLSHSNVGRNKSDATMRLCDGVEFSMTKFDKPNKGFCNTQKINCFMNVCLQSVLACPAFFNMLLAIANTQSIEDRLNPDGFLKHLVVTVRHFDPANQFDKDSL